jgi:diadenosine tetraphosphatase ApaH/serine/threonine PP2A family protein phosphatase
VITSETPDGVLAEILEDVRASVVVCGHTHVQFDRQVYGHRLVNAGSVGLPYEDAPGAYWLDLEGDRLELRRTDYDHEAAAARIRTSGCPHSERFVDSILSPMPAAEAAAQFEALRAGARHKG